MIFRRLLCLTISTLLTLAAGPIRAAVVYVDIDNMSGTENGTSWGTAWTTIQDGITAAGTGDELWVAEGVYPESITLKSNLEIYGGFAGSETMRDQRLIDTFVTTIDASTANGGSAADNVVFADTLTSVRIDGLTLTGSARTGVEFQFCDATTVIDGCTIRGCGTGATNPFGGGVALNISSTLISNCLIEENNSTQSGSGVHITGPFSAPYPTPRLLNCTITNNTGASAIQVVRAADVTIENCTVVSNLTGWGINLGFAREALVTGCVIVGNADGGIGLDGPANAIVRNTIVAGNFRTSSNSGGIFISGSAGTVVVENCIISGNGMAGIYAQFGADPIIRNCTISENLGTILIAATTGSAIYAGDSGFGIAAGDCDVTLINSTITGNPDVALYVDDADSSFLLTNNHFRDNPDGDYLDGPVVAMWTGATDINANVAGASGNVDGRPRFVAPITGTWTAAPAYNAGTNRTTMTDGAAAWTPGAMAGRLINTSDSQNLQTLVMSNTATTMIVAGDVTGYTSNADGYVLVDYRLDFHSELVDAGTGAGSPPADDILGNPRAVDIEGLGAEGTGTEFDIGAYEDQNLIHGLAGFSFGPIPALQVKDRPFPVTVTARGLQGQTLITYGGPVDLRAYATTGVDVEISDPGQTSATTPLRSQWPRARSEALYLASEIGTMDRIDSLSIEVTILPDIPLQEFTVRTRHTGRDVLPDDRTFHFDRWTQNYQTDLTIPASGWIEFPFSEPFLYNGTDNLIVDFSFSNPSGSNSGGTRFFLAADRFNDRFSTVAGEHPVNWDSVASGPTSFVPGIRLSGGNEVASIPTITGTFTAGVWTGDVTISTNGEVSLGVLEASGFVGNSNKFNLVDLNSAKHFNQYP